MMLLLHNAYGYGTEAGSRLVNWQHVIRLWPDEDQTRIQGTDVTGMLMSDGEVLYIKRKLLDIYALWTSARSVV